MVIVNPKLSLPIDLPYKKRQRPFNPSTPLQQATVRYNEAIRKQYNDIQFAKRCENGHISQIELTTVNTIDVSKQVDSQLFSEMSSLKPCPLGKQRKSKKIEACNAPGAVENVHCVPSSSTTTTTATAEVPPPYDCNDMQMFPQLSAAASTETPEGDKYAASHHSRSLRHSRAPSSVMPVEQFQSLEAQAIREYEPTVDSAHDMIFGNVMGVHYGNFIHGHLWSPPEFNNTTTYHQFNANQQQQHAVSNNFCGASKSVGYNLTSGTAGNDGYNSGSSNDSGMGNIGHCSVSAGPSTIIGNSGKNNKRSTSVPRPRTATRKETLKQAAIRCGIITPAVPKRSHYLEQLSVSVPLQLNPVQTDPPVVPVVEILHPRTLIPTCSSEALLEEMRNKIADSEFKKDGAHGTKSNSRISKNEDHGVEPNAKSSEANGRSPSQVRSVSDFRIIDNSPNP
ncbi:hypothetical protein Ocin01_12605 [Orchesella cincta]|uniref:Uncharacterized protein n=1 Tax=Orchesella cincta TaxID=48709 RepID=A0A1D2MMA6_ORCCI|nr:hypothetical protein Ocin01_12605 [Orchesella cincta]